MIKKGLLLSVILLGYAHSQNAPPANSPPDVNDAAQNKDSLPPSWYANGNIASQIPLNELREKDKVYILNEPSESVLEEFKKTQKEKDSDNLLTQDLYVALKKIKESNNKAINDLLSKNKDEGKILKDQIGDLLRLNQFLDDATSKDVIQWGDLVKAAPPGSVIIENVDQSQSMRVVKREISEEIIEMSGRIRVHYGSNTVTANRVIFNTETKYLTASGDLILEGPSYILKGDKFIFHVLENQGAISHPYGQVNDIYVQGELGKINNGNYYSILHATATFDVGRPIFFAEAGDAHYFGENQIAMNNVVLRIHNFPIFYTPIFLQDPFGTRVHLRYGFTQREGIFVQSDFNFFIPYLSQIDVNFDYYQKLGLHGKLANKQKSSFQDYEWSVAMANFYDGFYRQEIYNNYYNEDLRTDSYFRAKFLYNHTFNLTKQELREKNINTTLNFNFKKTGKTEKGSSFWKDNDPYFTSDYESREPRYISLDQFIRADPYSESQSLPQAKDADNYIITIAQTFPGSALQIKTNVENALQQKSSVVNTDFERKKYFQYLSSVTVPDVSFKYSGVIDPVQTAKTFDSATEPEKEDNKTFEDFFKKKRDIYANIDYSLQTSYYHKMRYTLASNSERSIFDFHENKYYVNFTLSRLFKLEKDLKKNYFKAFSADYKISLGNTYQQQWGGEEKLGADYKTSNEQNTFDDLIFTQDMNLYFPSKHYYDILSNKLGYLPMIPLASLNLSHNLTAREWLKEEDRNNPNKKFFNDFERHDIKLSPKIEQNGFGLFYIPYVNYKQDASMNYVHSFKPYIDKEGKTISFKTVSLREKYQPFISQWDLNYNLNLFLELPKLSYHPIDFRYAYVFNILDSVSHVVINKSLSQKFELNFNYKDEDTTKIAYVDLFNIKIRYNYFFQAQDYTQDSIDISASIKFTVVKYLQSELGVLSSNEQAYLYVPYKARAYGYSPVNFFGDIGKSLLFVGKTHQERSNNQKNSLFKLKKIYFSIFHDLQTWFLKVTYSASPSILDSNNTVKGFYFNHSVYMEVAMKDKFFLSKYVNSALIPWKTDVIPRELEFIQTQ